MAAGRGRMAWRAYRLKLTNRDWMTKTYIHVAFWTFSEIWTFRWVYPFVFWLILGRAVTGLNMVLPA
jgi:hypothetical protein